MSDSESLTLDDIDTTRSQEIGETIRDLNAGDMVRTTNHAMGSYVEGVVVEKRNNIDNEEVYWALIETEQGKARLQANWRDIPSDADDQETPFTGLMFEPFNDTPDSVTDIEVVDD